MRDRPTNRVRLATEADAASLPAVERSTGDVFRGVPGLSWIADDDVQSPEQHRIYARAGTSWVAVDVADRPFGFLSAERCGDELHIWELAVRRRHQRLSGLTLTTFRDLAWNEPLYRHMGFITLASEQLSERLSNVLANEHANGLPGERRCAMRLVL